MEWSKPDRSKRLGSPQSALAEPWSTIEFDSEKHAAFARAEMVEETLSDVRSLVALFLPPMPSALREPTIAAGMIYGQLDGNQASRCSASAYDLNGHFSSGNRG